MLYITLNNEPSETKLTPKPAISVIGLGYVGLCTALALANKGFNVIGIDNNREKTSKINQGNPPFYENNIQNLLKTNLQKGNIKCLTNQTEKAVHETDITFVTVGTPSKPDGNVDLKYLESAVKSIGKALKQKNNYHLIVIKSTVLPGTTEKTVKTLLEKESKKKCGKHFGLCMNPEFLQQGSALKNILHPDRIIIGTNDEKSGNTLEELYKQFHKEKTPPIIRTTPSTAELIKYASNAFLATKISFINTIANISQKIPNVDVKPVATAMGFDRRIGKNFLNAGLGYGGSCFPKDLKALISLSKKLKYKPPLLEAVQKVNDNQPLKAVQLCKEQLGQLKGKQIALLGLAFKPETDDMREAPSIPIINKLIQEKAKITVYDPKALKTAKSIFKNKIKYAKTTTECLKNAECCITVTEWIEFKKLEPQDFIKQMKTPILIDGRRIYNPKTFSHKMKFKAIGLGP